MTSSPLYPLLLNPQYDAKIWGGRKLETVLGKALPPDQLIGESLESGNSATVAAGSLASRDLGSLVDEYGDALLGSAGMRASSAFGDFPLLAKFIDASATLSIQVHPDDSNAPAGLRGKTEAWYIVSAEPGAELITGVQKNVSVDEVRDRITAQSLEDVLVREPVVAGDVIFVPAGTIHAIGAGILLYEIQESSDVTYRMYDWGRVDESTGQPRALHIEESLSVMKPGLRAQRPDAHHASKWETRLVACDYFVLDHLTVNETTVAPEWAQSSCHLVSTVNGTLTISTAAGDVLVSSGQTVLVPASVAVDAITGPGHALHAWVPTSGE